MADRETGTVKKWNEKGFGFIERDSMGDSIFVHARNTADRQPLVRGSKVSFVYEPDEKGGKATEVVVEEAAEAPVDETVRETGTVKRWQADKGFGFVGRANGEPDAFFHKKSFGGSGEPYVGQNVSFVVEEGQKGVAAVQVKEEKGGVPAEEAPAEDEGEREMGKVKAYSEEKGFAFIVRCSDASEIFGHKREFPKDVEPFVGQPVSFIVESTDRGDTAKKIREEESVPDIPLSDAGRDFGTLKNFNSEKGFGFIINRKGGEEVRFFEKALNGLVPEKNMCVSFVLEEGEKGALAKDLREEAIERVKRVTAEVHYGTVERYCDPPASKPTSGYGFIIPLSQKNAKKPKKVYFHMDEIMTPDENGGIEPDTLVSYIIIEARKGWQAAAVTICDPPKAEDGDKENEKPLENAMWGLKVDETTESNGARGANSWADAWA